MKETGNGGPARRPYQRPELRKLAPDEAQARLREYALRAGAAPLQLLHRPPRRGLVR